MSTESLPGPVDRAGQRGPSTFSFREIGTILLFTGISVVLLDILFYSSTLEDAYITFRYSVHLAEGHGVGAWNTQGERVEGYTSLVWMLLVGAAHAAEIDVRTAAKAMGIFSHLVLCGVLVAYPLLRRAPGERRGDIFENPNEAVLAGVFLALYLPVCWYATSGMETVFFSALTGLALVSVLLRRSRVLLPVLLVLLVLTRPEGVPVAIAAIALESMLCRREGRSLHTAAIAAAIVAFSLGLLVVHRLIVFDDIVPNT